MRTEIMEYAKYQISGCDREKYALPWVELMRPDTLGYPFEFLRKPDDRRLSRGSQILEEAASSSLTEQMEAARRCGIPEIKSNRSLVRALWKGMWSLQRR